ncbi:hypothetical protein KP509_26G029800 [Ceratopteris richardii]|uniref:Uncharacterized protein n=1 Tax=Ceratopteris richardii TaxID=49495 RepID=A0A8T2RLM4_CERRI|nr:hypothetical protein KP509_26G029800 [Ceratopteris richardii]
MVGKTAMVDFIKKEGLLNTSRSYQLCLSCPVHQTNDPCDYLSKCEETSLSLSLSLSLSALSINPSLSARKDGHGQNLSFAVCRENRLRPNFLLFIKKKKNH